MEVTTVSARLQGSRSIEDLLPGSLFVVMLGYINASFKATEL